MSYLVVATTSSYGAQSTFAYLHPHDQRLQLSPDFYPEPIQALDDARRAFDLVVDFYLEEGPYQMYVTLTGPNGVFQSHYTGPKGEPREDLLRSNRNTVEAAL